MNTRKIGSCMVIAGSLSLYAIAMISINENQKAQKRAILLQKKNNALNTWLDNAVKVMTPEQLSQMTVNSLDDFTFQELTQQF
jgi:hypothetical protein